jgi:hypothetical protein
MVLLMNDQEHRNNVCDKLDTIVAQLGFLAGIGCVIVACISPLAISVVAGFGAFVCFLNSLLKACRVWWNQGRRMAGKSGRS